MKAEVLALALAATAVTTPAQETGVRTTPSLGREGSAGKASAAPWAGATPLSAAGVSGTSTQGKPPGGHTGADVGLPLLEQIGAWALNSLLIHVGAHCPQPCRSWNQFPSPGAQRLVAVGEAAFFNT